MRIYTHRDGDGTTSADCRINGVDWAAGIEAVSSYATTWPGRGFESRKQYIVIQNAPQGSLGGESGLGAGEAR